MDVYKRIKKMEDKDLDYIVKRIFIRLPKKDRLEVSRLHRLITKNTLKREALIKKLMKDSGLIEGKHEYNMVYASLWLKLNELK